MTQQTILTFKEKQDELQKTIHKLYQFIQKGQEFGLNPDSTLMKKLETASQSVQNKVLKVALIGGFSEGKTSIAAAWLGRLDQDMNISQEESSNEVKIYKPSEDIELIDTPGLFGFKEQTNSAGEIEKYKELTKKYVSEAHLILYVMNSVNPIKDSHSEDLNWLFRDLNLLPRTVFVLSRFDEVADVEDDGDYRNNLKIKRDNIIARLKTTINLTEDEEKRIPIVAISANPFGEGMEYWLNNPEEFSTLSHISTLQDATMETIANNGGATPIVIEAQKSMLQDVLIKQLPLVREKQEILTRELLELTEKQKFLKYEIEPLKAKIIGVRQSLRNFIENYFKGLIAQVKGTDLATFGIFVDNEIGQDGIYIQNRIQQEFEIQCQSISSDLNKISFEFKNELEKFESTIGTDLFKKGFTELSKATFTNTNIIAARDGIVSVGKILGKDWAKALKFKPYGAVNVANKLNSAIAAVGLAFELWDTYKKIEMENQHREAVGQFIQDFSEQQKSLIDLVQSDDFINDFFPEYVSLQNQFNEINRYNEQSDIRKAAFDKWQQEGEIIDAEFRVLDS